MIKNWPVKRNGSETSCKQTFHWLIFRLNVCVCSSVLPLCVGVLSLCAMITDSKKKETQTVWLCLVDIMKH